MKVCDLPVLFSFSASFHNSTNNILHYISAIRTFPDSLVGLSWRMFSYSRSDASLLWVFCFPFSLRSQSLFSSHFAHLSMPCLMVLPLFHRSSDQASHSLKLSWHCVKVKLQRGSPMENISAHDANKIVKIP